MTYVSKKFFLATKAISKATPLKDFTPEAVLENKPKGFVPSYYLPYFNGLRSFRIHDDLDQIWYEGCKLCS